MKAVLSSVFLISAVAFAQERCDSSSPPIFCNSTEILAYQSDECRPVHIFVSRGSDEPYPGRLGNLTKQICAGIGGTEDCGFENVEYPAKSTAWGPDVWCKSAGKGASNGQAQMKAYSEKCPDSKLMVLGFSQGGAVAQDMLGGGGGKVFACEQDVNPALDRDTAPGANVIAAVTFGAVVRSHGQNFTVGEGKNYDGRRARTPEQLEALNKYSGVFLDYCHNGDPMCAVGSTPESVEQHLNYFTEHNEEVTKHLVSIAKGQGSVSDGNTTPSKPQSSSAAAKPSTNAKPVTSSTATDGTEAKPTQSAQSAQNGNGQTGAAGSLTVGGGYLAVLGAVGAVLMLVV